MKLGDGDRSFLRITSSQRYYSSAFNGTALTTLVNTVSGRLFATPFFVARNLSIDRLAFNVTTLIAAKLANAGIYQDDGNVYPGKKILQGSEFGTDTAGVKEYTPAAPLILSSGKLYWFAFWTNSTVTGAFRSIPVASLLASLLGIDSALGTALGVGWYYDGVYSATMPDPFTAGGTIFTSAVHASIPAVFVRAT